MFVINVDDVSSYYQKIEFILSWFGVCCSIHWRESGCDGKTALGMAVELKYNVNVDAYLGMPCSDCT